MGTLTLSRFFVAHVFLLPAAILGLVAAHVYLFRKAGAAGPPSEDPVKPRMPTERFYPKQVLMDTAVALLMICVLGLLSHFSSDRTRTESEPGRHTVCSAPGMVLPADFPMAEIFQGPARCRRHCRHSDAHRDSHHRVTVYRSPFGTASVEAPVRSQHLSRNSRRR